MKNKIDNLRLYHDLAWTWPIISPPEEYVDETEDIIRFINDHARIPIKKVLNLGCGGGHNDSTLKRHFNVTGIDISETMLALAKRLNPEVNYSYGDMRSVRLNEKYDAVIIFDSINYMLTVVDLKSALTTAYDHLKPGGVFATYIEIWKEKFEQNKTTHLFRKKGNIEITLVENYYDPDREDTWYEDNMVYLIRKSGELKVESDRHILGLFPLATWLDALNEVGFEAYQLPSNITNPAGETCPALIGVRPPTE